MASKTSPIKKGLIQPLLSPTISLSKNIREYPALKIAVKDAMIVVSVTKETATELPSRCFLIYPNMLFRLPPVSKFSPGSIIRTTPVKASSKRSLETMILPLAGSFKNTLSFEKPLQTTK